MPKVLVAVTLFFLLIASSARAERLIRPGRFIHEMTSRAGGTSNSMTVRDEPLASLPKLGGGPMPSRNNKFRRALGALVVTRDLEIPGAHALGLGFRLIPGKDALGGEAQIPFVLQARFGASRLGLVVGGRF